GLHALVRAGRVDRRHRTGDRLATLAAVPGRDDRVEDRGLRLHREVDARRPTGVDGDVLRDRAVPDAGDPDVLDAAAEACEGVGSVALGDDAVGGSGDGDRDVGDRLLRRAVGHLAADGTGGILGAQSSGTQETHDQYGNDMTDYSHTPAPRQSEKRD